MRDLHILKCRYMNAIPYGENRSTGVRVFLSLPSYMCIPNKGNNKNEILYK